MKREKSFCLSLSHFAQASTAALIALAPAQAARANTITKCFVKKDMAQNVSGMDLGSWAPWAFCSFFGTLSIDVTVGSIGTIAISFPGRLRINRKAGFSSPMPSTSDGMFTAGNNDSDLLILDFNTTHTPASEVGFDSGSILGLSPGNPQTRTPLYADLSGRIAPVRNPHAWAAWN